MESWYWGFGISVAALVLSLVFAVIKHGMRYKQGQVVDASKILFVGVLIAAVSLHMPIYLAVFQAANGNWIKAITLSVLEAAHLFSNGGDLDLILGGAAAAGLSAPFREAYSWLTVVLFAVAPVMTVGFVLSFFKNLSAYGKYLCRFTSKAFVFSDLNERSLALAESLLKKDARRTVVFTSAFTGEGENAAECLERAKALGAICFKKDVLSVKFRLHHPKKEITFFLLGDNDPKNIRQAMALIARYKDRQNTRLYVFSQTTAGELLLNSVDKGSMRVRRVNEVCSLISRTLYEKGQSLFTRALPSENGEKTISALILGMGQHGAEMVKGLTWFCQMDGYRLYVNAFDLLPEADALFEAQCPELMDPRYNGDFITPGEAHYDIRVHPGMDVQSKRFIDKVLSLPTVTYVFVALGDDERNIATAVMLRSLFRKRGIHPKIQAVVYHSEKKEALMRGITNFKNQSYDIEFVGDLRESYSEAVILGSKVERAALIRHLYWDKTQEESFWRYEYNYKSSVASAVHQRAVYELDVPGARCRLAERPEKEKMALACLEHRRWNAYMRTEGYCFAEKRDDLSKVHHNLVPFDELPDETKALDVIDEYYPEGDE